MKFRALVTNEFFITVAHFRILSVVLTVTISPTFLTVKIIVKCVVLENIHTHLTEKLKSYCICITKLTSF